MIPDSLDTAIALVNPDLPLPELAERIGEAKNALAFIKERIRDAETALDERMMECVRAHGPIEVAGMLYIISTPKTTKCVDVPAAVEALLGAVGGDFHRFCQLLSAQPIKYGAAKQQLAEDVFNLLFVTEARDKLDAKPVVAGIPTKYVKARAG
jgi:hypothetical protein